jgi:uncharacterized protein with NAD-binding domain and iron-sulfur cluster
VIVIGGGVGGLTVAHELIERGFTVDVYEARGSWGGKSRSQPVAGSETNGRRPLPGEHGFRFYPRFYKHVIDTMSRIPSGGASVVERLRPTTESAIALVDRATWYRFFRRRVSRPFEVIEALELFFQELDFDNRDIGLFTVKILQFLTSSDERRLAEYERMSWWEFLDGDCYSENFQRQLRAVPRTMVAMDPRRGSARTVGTISMQLIMDYADTGVSNDRTMGGPTSEMWIDPWIDRLHALGVAFHANSKCTAIHVAGGAISGVEVAGGVKTADHYVLAVPIDIAIGLISAPMAALDPALARLRAANADDLVSWMTGIQFFLYEDVPLVRGHTFYPDSPWALTTISQPQFWRDLGLFRTRYGNGEVGGLISVDISDWDTPGMLSNKTAKQCTADEVAKEVWAQMKAGLNGITPDEAVLTDAMLHSWHIDDDLDYAGGSPPINNSRLLVHPPGSWALRPTAKTAIPNLFLAADYVRTHTDLASMEGACEAGREAANGILDASSSPAARAKIWPLTEPAAFARAKRLDAWLHRQGRPHAFEILGIKNAARAAAFLYRLEKLTGLAKIDDYFDGRVRLTRTFRAILELLGFG